MAFNNNIKPAKDINGVRRSAFWHLGRRDHSEYELREKIGRKTECQQWIESVISECFEYGYLNDQRFIENFIRASQQKGLGIARIKRELQRKGISTNELNQAFTADHYDYLESAVSLLSGKFQTSLCNPHQKQKAMRFLQSKGHSIDDILQAISVHNEDYDNEAGDSLNEAIGLLSRKFKAAMSDRKMRDKATRFLISRGYPYNETQDAINRYNAQINNED